MSIRLMGNVWDNGPDDPTDNSVLLRLAYRANDHGESCFPSIAEICQKTRRSESTVIRSIAQLKQDGWITVERGNGKGHVSQYKLDVGRLKGCHHDNSKDVTVTPKEAEQRVSPCLPKGVTVQPKGVTVTKPPTPPLKEERSRKVIEQQGESLFSDADSKTFPEWLPLDLWRDYLAMRKTLKKPATERAEKLAIRTLGKLRDAGHSPAEVLEQSIFNSWQGLFAIKGSSQNGSKPKEKIQWVDYKTGLPIVVGSVR